MPVQKFRPPRKRFGQHFLTDESIIRAILSSLSLNKDETYVEIGPGRGALTLPLLKELGRLHVVELDRDMIEPLYSKCKQAGELIVHQADALKFNFADISKKDFHLVGNLPYNISTPLIFHLLSFLNIKNMHFMLQKEVAQRIAASPGSSSYGRLSVMVQYKCAVELLFDVSPSAFDPPPKVNSSVIRLVPFKNKLYSAKNYDLFAMLVKTSFSQRRKTLKNNLKKLIKDQENNLPVDLSLRAEQLSVEDFVALSNALSES